MDRNSNVRMTNTNTTENVSILILLSPTKIANHDTK